MVIEATISHNGLIWAVVHEDDLPSLVSVLPGGLGTVQFSVDRDDGSEEWRALKGMLVEPSDDEKLDFGLHGRILGSQGSSFSPGRTGLDAVRPGPADPAEFGRGMRQLRLDGFDERLQRQSPRIVFELG